MTASFSKILILSLLLVLSSCFSAPKFLGVSNFKMEGYKQKENTLRFSLDLSVFNPNAYGIRIRRSAVDVYIGDYHLGKGMLEKSFKMKRKQETLCHVPVKLQLERGAMFKLLGLVTKKNAKIRIEGRVKAMVFGIPKREYINQERLVNLKDMNINLGGLLQNAF